MMLILVFICYVLGYVMMNVLFVVVVVLFIYMIKGKEV